MIFDYKSSDTRQDAGARRIASSGEWIDLQLPLYRHLAAGLGIEGPWSWPTSSCPRTSAT